jgi:hypothetical protein
MDSGIFGDFPKEIVLKDSTLCEFRIAYGTEGDDLYDFFKRVSPDDLWVMRRDYTKRESIEPFVQSLNPSEHICIIAYQEGSIIGIGSLYFSTFGARQDIGEVEIIVAESFKQKRLGTWLILELASIAAALQLEILKIELISGKDDAAIIATKRANFIPQATLKNYLKDRNGTLQDVVILIKEISEEWSDY